MKESHEGYFWGFLPKKLEQRKPRKVRFCIPKQRKDDTFSLLPPSLSLHARGVVSGRKWRAKTCSLSLYERYSGSFERGEGRRKKEKGNQVRQREKEKEKGKFAGDVQKNQVLHEKSRKERKTDKEK